NLLAKNAGSLVVIVEGEKCADAAGEVFPGAFVTTSPGGAGAANKADWKPLAQTKEGVIWPDADAAGRAYAEKVALTLHQLGVPTIYILDAIALGGGTPHGGTRNPPLGWAVANALDEGWTAAALRKRAEEAAKRRMAPSAQPEWPVDFEMTEDGLVRLTCKDETIEAHRFTGPFQVIGEGRDRVGAGRGLWLAWQDRD